MQAWRILNKTLSFFYLSSAGKINFWLLNCKERSKGKTDNPNKGQGDVGCLHSCSLVCFIQAFFQAECIYRRIKGGVFLYLQINDAVTKSDLNIKVKSPLYITLCGAFGANLGNSSQMCQVLHCTILMFWRIVIDFTSLKLAKASTFFFFFFSMLCNARENIFILA